MIIEGKRLGEMTIADRVTLVPRPTGIPPTPPESASAAETYVKNLEGSLW